MQIKITNSDGKSSAGFVLLLAVLLASFAYSAPLVSAGKSPSALPSPPSITYASADPLKVRPGDSMLNSNPSGASSVSAGMGWIKAIFFISMAHYTGWWKHG